MNGWGRIHVVERLAQTENAEIKHWLLREGYRNSGRWYQVMARCDEDRIADVIADVIAFAGQNIDLEKIATGPADEMRLGPGWEHHQCLDVFG